MESFETLQASLSRVVSLNRPGQTWPHVMVVLPSLSMGEAVIAHYGPRLPALEHRYLAAFFLLHRIPNAEVVYVSTLAPAEEVMEIHRVTIQQTNRRTTSCLQPRTHPPPAYYTRPPAARSRLACRARQPLLAADTADPASFHITFPKLEAVLGVRSPFITPTRPQKAYKLATLGKLTRNFGYSGWPNGSWPLSSASTLQLRPDERSQIKHEFRLSGQSHAGQEELQPILRLQEAITMDWGA